jgi:tripartite-type tricarboxylate transporter receptor subunit TctC
MNKLTFLFASVLAMLAHPICAKDYPTRPVTLIVPFTAGGPNDTVARHLSHVMSQHLGQTIVVENRPSVGGVIGTESVARAEPNGYTLLSQSFAFATQRGSDNPLSIDPLKDFDYIGEFGNMPMVLVGNIKSQSHTLKELTTRAKNNPGQLNIANSGAGSPSHLCSVLIQDSMKVSMTSIPYKGNAPALIDLQNGNIDLLCAQVSVVLPLINANKVKVYAVTTRNRIPQLPKVPTFVEQGFSSVDLTMWHGIFAPKHTPRSVVNRLVESLQSTVTDPVFKEKMYQSGGSAATKSQATPQQLESHLAFEANRWIPLLKNQQ